MNLIGEALELPQVRAREGIVSFEHPELGRLHFIHAQTIPTGAPDLRLTVYAPGDDATRAVLAAL